MGSAAKPKLQQMLLMREVIVTPMHMLRVTHAGLAVVCRHVPSVIQHHVPGFVFSRVLRW